MRACVWLSVNGKRKPAACDHPQVAKDQSLFFSDQIATLFLSKTIDACGARPSPDPVLALAT